MQIFLNEQNQQKNQQKCFKIVYCIAVTIVILEKGKAWKQLLSAALGIKCSWYLGKILENTSEELFLIELSYKILLNSYFLGDFA